MKMVFWVTSSWMVAEGVVLALWKATGGEAAGTTGAITSCGAGATCDVVNSLPHKKLDNLNL